MKILMGSLRRRWIAFWKDRRAVIGPLFALTLVPLAGLFGTALDYNKANALKTQLQAATDAAVLAIAPLAGTKQASDLRQIAEKIVKGMVPDPSVSVETPEISTGRTTISLNTSMQYKALYFTMPGQDGLVTIHAYAQSIISKNTYEIALVLDNSGSMASSAGGSSKMDSAKDAATQLVSAMQSTESARLRTKISIVPFTLSVQVGTQYANAGWMDTQGRSSIHWQTFDRTGSWQPRSRFDLFTELNQSWGGCVESRPGSWGTSDTAPTPGDPDSYFVPQFAPDEPGNAGSTSFSFTSLNPWGGMTTTNWSYPNSYINDNPTATCTVPERTTNDQYALAQNKVCKYRNRPSVNTSSSRGPNYMCNAKPLLRLTDNTTALNASINGMAADGNTNLFEGFMWGWRTLSPNAPFPDGRAYSDPDNRKIVILMTDGMNAWNAQTNHNKSVYSPFGFYTNDRLTTGVQNATQGRAAIDAKTREACTNAKAKGITVYTVGFSVSGDPIDSAGLSVLRDCASSANMAYVANDSTGIVTVFREIAANIGALRISR